MNRRNPISTSRSVVRRRASMLALMLGAATLLGCGAQMHPGAPTRLRVVAEPASARVFIDDRYVANARVLDARPRRVEAGPHQISLEADGYFPHDLELELPPGTTTLRVSLRPIPR